MPHSALTRAMAVLATVAMMAGLGLATAGLTNSPEHAQVTTLPVALGVIAVASWVGITGTEELAQVKRLLPGGAATELVLNAWNGGVAVTDSLILLAPTLAWVAVAVTTTGPVTVAGHSRTARPAVRSSEQADDEGDQDQVTDLDEVAVKVTGSPVWAVARDLVSVTSGVGGSTSRKLDRAVFQLLAR